MDCKNDGRHDNYKTLQQWEKLGKKPKRKAKGVELYANGYKQMVCTCYAPEQVQDMSERELKQRDFEKYCANEIKKYKAEIEGLENDNRRLLRELRQTENISSKKDDFIYNLKSRLISYRVRAGELEPYPTDEKLIVIDLETTGLNSYYDEILQISIINGLGEILLNSYVKPVNTAEWKEAQAINGITPDMVANAPTIDELKEQIKEILKNADLVVGYNLEFDLDFICGYVDNVYVYPYSSYDVMLEFARVYGEYNDYYKNYKWQKLTTCARFLGYEFKAHDSLEDCKATLYSYKILKLIEECLDND